ncbi:MAG: DUF4157 domain-containing protein, partial [Chloroflexi bacterium]|nr:DUF4157 domain-containing protein [Chloroflexota bacterium]
MQQVLSARSGNSGVMRKQSGGAEAAKMPEPETDSENDLGLGGSSGQISADVPPDDSSQKPQAKTQNPTIQNHIQPKLTVNQPHDPYEQEADQIADAVMASKSEPGAPEVPNQEIKIQRQVTSPPDEIGQSQTLDQETEAQVEATQRGGDPLPAQEQTFFESRMGQDFSQVRLHTDEQAQQTSEDLQARAFTVGQDVAFNEGEYQPGTD